MRVLISGGDIAGLTLAYWLHWHHMSSVVIEQSQYLRRDGYAIDFLGTGYAVAERMDLIDRLHAQHIPFQALIYVNKTGKQIAKLDPSLLRAITDGKYMRLMHSTFEEALYEAVADQVEVRFGRSLTHIEPGPDAVEVTFNDGTTESFDLLIGADGMHSNTRVLVFGPEDQFSRSLGYTIACYPLADRYSIGKAFQDVCRAGTAGRRLQHTKSGQHPHVFYISDCHLAHTASCRLVYHRTMGRRRNRLAEGLPELTGRCPVQGCASLSAARQVLQVFISPRADVSDRSVFEVELQVDPDGCYCRAARSFGRK
jgi:2-polyprenyl-6-methoxyphenol hydroxylase-like FAD-dependent oxidoreductase